MKRMGSQSIQLSISINGAPVCVMPGVAAIDVLTVATTLLPMLMQMMSAMKAMTTESMLLIMLLPLMVSETVELARVKLELMLSEMLSETSSSDRIGFSAYISFNFSNDFCFLCFGSIVVLL